MGPNDGLERVRILAAKTLLALIVAMTVSTLTGVTPDVDIAVFATTMGGLLACLGAGSVINLIGGGKG